MPPAPPPGSPWKRGIAAALLTLSVAAATAWAYVHFRAPMRPDFVFDPTQPFQLEQIAHSWYNGSIRITTIDSTGKVQYQIGSNGRNWTVRKAERYGFSISGEQVRAIAAAIENHRANEFRNGDMEAPADGPIWLFALRQGHQPPRAVYGESAKMGTFFGDLNQILGDRDTSALPRESLPFDALNSAREELERYLVKEETEKTQRLYNLLLVVGGITLGAIVVVTLIPRTHPKPADALE